MVKARWKPADILGMEYPNESWPHLVAYALHDGPMQTVVSVGLELDSLSKLIGSDRPPSAAETRSELQRLRAATQQAAAELRAIVRQLSDDPEQVGAALGSGPGQAAARWSGDPPNEGFAP